MPRRSCGLRVDGSGERFHQARQEKAMSRPKANELLRLVESFFREHLERMRGVSPAYHPRLPGCRSLCFTFIADKNRRDVAHLQLTDLQVEAVKASLHWNPSEATNPPNP